VAKAKSESLTSSTRLPQLLAATSIGLALLALVGWLANVHVLAGQWGSYVPLSPSTALAFLLLAGALFCFVLLAAFTLADLLLHRDRARLDVALVFISLSAGIILHRASRVYPLPSPVGDAAP
jgi:hypothetical protein